MNGMGHTPDTGDITFSIPVSGFIPVYVTLFNILTRPTSLDRITLADTERGFYVPVPSFCVIRLSLTKPVQTGRSLMRLSLSSGSTFYTSASSTLRK